MSDIHQALASLKRPIFTTKEIAAISGRSVSSISTSLTLLGKKGMITKMKRGVWADTKNPNFEPLSLTPYVVEGHRYYISFLTAMHLGGVISQIPKIIFVATPHHTAVVKTPVATYSFHQISAPFFAGFDWAKSGNYLIAFPEKALVDCLYLSGSKGKRFGHFPEITLDKNFSLQKARKWVNLIENVKLREYVSRKLKELVG